MDFDAGLDFSAGEAEFLAKDSAAGLALMSDVLFQPAFPKEECVDRRSFVIGSAAAAAAFRPSLAQDAYPSRAITVINPFPPGGVSDTITRPLDAALEAVLAAGARDATVQVTARAVEPWLARLGGAGGALRATGQTGR